MSKQLIPNDIINVLKSSAEFKKSKAIADCMTYLINQIKLLESENEKLNAFINNKNEQFLKVKDELDTRNNEFNLLQDKVKILEEINKNLEQTIKEFKNKMVTENKNFNSKCENFALTLSQYKKILEDLKAEKEENNKIISNLKLENEKIKESQKNAENFNKKIKDYELLLYNMDLENQNFKNIIKKYHNKLGNKDDIDFQIKKIDLNAELETIENSNNI